MRSAFGHANQKCSAASRVLVADSVYATIRDRLVEAARSLRSGPADAPETQINPVIDAEARARLMRDAQTARTECEVLLDRFEEAAGDGELSLGPLVVELPAARAQAARTTTEELFGPILALIPFATEEEAYAVANGTDYGLTAGIFSRSPATIERASRAIEAGNVYANRAITAARVGVEPFGGMKMSGTGPKAGDSDYLWAFVRRTDAPSDDPGARLPAPSDVTTPAPELPSSGWDAPLHAASTWSSGPRCCSARTGGTRTRVCSWQPHRPLAASSAAPSRPSPSPASAPSCATTRPAASDCSTRPGPDATWWLAATLLAGNSLALFDSRGLYPVTAALLRAGLPPELVQPDPGGLGAMLAAARRPEVAFAATDGGRGPRPRAAPRAGADGARSASAQGAALAPRRSAGWGAGVRAAVRVAEAGRRAHAAPRRRPGPRSG